MSSGDTNSLGFIQTTVDPDHGVLPPITEVKSAFSKTFDLNGSFHVDDSALTGEKVSTQRGVIIWSPQRGLQSIARLGIVNSGVTSEYSTPYTFVFNSEVGLPYAASENITISPDPEINFSSTRLYAGRIRVESTTAPIGATALNGWLGSGNLADVRDAIGTDSSTDYMSVPALNQQSISSKDAYKQIPIAAGLVATVGCDIPSQFRPPKGDNFCRTYGGNEHHVLEVGFLNATWHAMSTGGIVLMSAMNSLWISPYDIKCNVTGVESLQVGMINPFGEPRMRIGVEENWTATTNMNVAPVGREVFVTHYFAHLGIGTEAGRIIYTKTTEKASFGGGYLLTGITNNFNDGSVNVLPEFHSFRLREAPDSPINPKAFYIGSMVQTHVTIQDTSPGAIVTMSGTIKLHLDFFANDIYSEGELGPFRVIRYDEVGNGQVINVRGRLMVECVAEGQIAPYVQPSSITNPMSYNVNLFGMLGMLYNSTNPYFRRIYIAAEYDKIIEELRRSGVNELISGHSSYDSRMKYIANAAGVFGDLGNRIGGIFNHAETGERIGSAIDNILPYAERLLGSSAGQFGEAAGEFGSGKRIRLY